MYLSSLKCTNIQMIVITYNNLNVRSCTLRLAVEKLKKKLLKIIKVFEVFMRQFINDIFGVNFDIFGSLRVISMLN